MKEIVLDPNWITAVATAITAAVAIYVILSGWMDKKKASLSVSMGTIFHCAEYTIAALIIRNDGPARARDVKIIINNTPFQEYGPATKTAQPYKNVIDPKSKIQYILKFESLSPPQDVVIHWSDDSRGDHSINALLRPNVDE